MFNVKSNVLFIIFFIQVSYVICVNYCDICNNHTLCKYSIPGYNKSCVGYDDRVVISKNDINIISRRINERRNFVATGLSRNSLLPHAANMRKIEWSKDLAVFAQRWADQCEPNQHPDVEDECRNLEEMKVGQCVASISGLTSGLNIKSFIDSWFMDSLTYKGSVSYYNQSTDYDNRQFTQLIWARTFLVGCGRAKFLSNKRRTAIDRLVCNFAPSGNIHGETVYAIGFPTTQCERGTIPDTAYPALCAPVHTAPGIIFPGQQHMQQEPLKPPFVSETSTKETARVSSLLRILNLANSTLTPGINHLQSNVKFKEASANRSSSNANKKIRHIVRNVSEDYNFEHQPNDHPRNYKYVSIRRHYLTNNRSTKMHHNYNSQDSLRSIIHKCTRKIANNVEVRSTAPCTYSIFKPESSCTRKLKNYKSIEDHTSKSLYPKLYETSTCSEVNPNNYKRCTRKNKNSDTKYTCSIPIICQCLSMGSCSTQKYPGRQNYITGSFETRSIGNPLNIFHPKSYYEHLRNPNNREENDAVFINEDRYQENNTHFRFVRNPKNLTNKISVINHLEKRTKRQHSEEEIHPFWQESSLINKPRYLKSLRYTTFPKKRNRKTYDAERGPHFQNLYKNEEITIKPSEDVIPAFSRDHSIPEKYLSFDELMTLRKNEMEYLDMDSRRQKKPAAYKVTTTKKKAPVTAKKAVATTKKATTTKATTTTTEKCTSTTKVTTIYPKLKHCTRRLTCTWTAPTVLGGGFNVTGNRGSRTPPGYIEGCSRTSTCTREYMERNKLPPTESAVGATGVTEDDDYCEKRALKVQRRNLDVKSKSEFEFNDDKVMLATPPIKIFTHKPGIKLSVVRPSSTKITEDKYPNQCICSENIET